MYIYDQTVSTEMITLLILKNLIYPHANTLKEWHVWTRNSATFHDTHPKLKKQKLSAEFGKTKYPLPVVFLFLLVIKTAA